MMLVLGKSGIIHIIDAQVSAMIYSTRNTRSKTLHFHACEVSKMELSLHRKMKSMVFHKKRIKQQTN